MKFRRLHKNLNCHLKKNTSISVKNWALDENFIVARKYLLKIFD